MLTGASDFYVRSKNKMDKYNLYKIAATKPAEKTADGASQYESAEELLAAKLPAGIVIIETGVSSHLQSNDIFETLLALRQDPEFYLAPIFLTTLISDLKGFADGIAQTMEEMTAAGTLILQRRKEIKHEEIRNDNRLRLLAFIYSRGTMYELKPHCMPCLGTIYTYPPAILLLGETAAVRESATQNSGAADYGPQTKRISESAKTLIRELYENKYIERTQLYDRIRKCPKCNSGHINYIDLCPECGSLNIEKKTMLHCFTCGNVAPEEEFRSGTTLVCKRCATRLRHIGSDYDHPLESYLCGDCGTSFIEPEIKAACFDCSARTSPDELSYENLYGYRLTAKGIDSAKRGILSEEFMLFGNTHIVDMQIFSGIMNWLLALRRRYADADFSLLRVRLTGLAEAEEVLGNAKLRELLSEIKTRIQDFVRDTDISLLSDEHTVWILLPRTSFEGASVLASRLTNLSKLYDIPGADKLSLSVKPFFISEKESTMTPTELIKIFSETN